MSRVKRRINEPENLFYFNICFVKPLNMSGTGRHGSAPVPSSHKQTHSHTPSAGVWLGLKDQGKWGHCCPLSYQMSWKMRGGEPRLLLTVLLTALSAGRPLLFSVRLPLALPPFSHCVCLNTAATYEFSMALKQPRDLPPSFVSYTNARFYSRDSSCPFLRLAWPRFTGEQEERRVPHSNSICSELSSS